MESNDSLKLTKEEINGIGDFLSGLDMLAERDLLFNHIDCLEDVKDVLSLFYYPKCGNTYQSKCVDKIYFDYNQIMDEIKKLLEKVERFLQDTSFKKEFNDVYIPCENRTKDIIEECSKIVDLRYFPILVAGDAKSGKSTFINLMLGRDLLPTDVVTCTKIICEIRNSPQLRVTYLTGGKEVHQQILPEYGDVIKALDRKAMEKYEKAIIEYPVDFLNDYTALVDSPAIGSNQELELITYEYINRNSSVFIFVLDSTNFSKPNSKAKELIRKANEQIEKITRILDSFHEEYVKEQEKAKAIFILNHWDIVKMNAKDESEVTCIREKIIEQIKQLWCESIDENKSIFFLNARQAREWMKHGIVRNDVLTIRQCLIDLVVVNYSKNLKNALRLLNIILSYVEQRIIEQMNFFVRYKYDLQIGKCRAQQICDQLEKYIKTVDVKAKQIENELQPELKEIVNSLTSFIKSEEVKNRMLGISKPHGKSIETAEIILMKLFEEELKKVIKDWNDQEGKIEHVTAFLESLFEKHLKEIGEGILPPSNLINKFTLLNSWNSEMIRNQNLGGQISKAEQALIIGTVTLLSPFVIIAGLLTLPLIVHHASKEKRKSKIKLKSYKANPDLYLNNVIIDTFNKLHEDDIQMRYLNKIYLKCHERIDAFKMFIIMELEDKREMIEKIKFEERSTPISIENIHKLYEKIQEYYSEYHLLRLNSFPDQSLMISLPHHILDSFACGEVEILTSGHYSILFRLRNQPNRDVIYKTFRKKFIKPYARYQMQEIEFLNLTSDFTLKCKSFARFDKEEKLILIFGNVRCNLNTYLFDNTHLIPINYEYESVDWWKAFRFILDVSIQLCQCLQYLNSHTYPMIHPDLRMETVLVSEEDDNGKVKILFCDACTNLPTVPYHRKYEPDAKWLHEPYDISSYTMANILSAGMIFYKMAYYKNNKWCHFVVVDSIAELFSHSTEAFLSVGNTITITWTDELHNKLPKKFNELVERCLSNEVQNRPSLNECIETLKSLM